MTLATAALGFCLFMTFTSCVYYALVIVAALRFRSSPKPSPGFTPPVSILKPLRGLDRDTYNTLASFCTQDYPHYEVLFAVADQADPAVEVVRRLQLDFPHVAIRLLVVDRHHGTNRKVDSLDCMYRQMRSDYLVMSDSDMRVTPEYLRAVMGPLRDPEVGLVTCFYRGEPGGTAASVFEAVGFTGEFHASAMVARMLEGVKFAFGSTMAAPKSAIEAIGGFTPLADYLADDFEIGNRIAASERRVVLSHYVVNTVLPPDTWSSMIRHQFRWVRSAAASRPKGHAGLILTWGLPFAPLALWLAPGLTASWVFFDLWLGLRLAAAWIAGVLVLRDPLLKKYLLLAPLRDCISVGLWAASFFSRRIQWKDDRFELQGTKIRGV